MQMKCFIEDEKYQNLINKKVSEVSQLDFLDYFNKFSNEINNYNVEQLRFMDSILQYFKIVIETRDEDIDFSVNKAYQKIISTGIYQKYKEREIELSYPLIEDSLYDLELDYVSFLKNENHTLEQYYILLQSLLYLLPVVTKKTIYIVHNILLYYKELEIKNVDFETYGDVMTDSYNKIKNSKVYQKFKK